MLKNYSTFKSQLYSYSFLNFFILLNILFLLIIISIFFFYTFFFFFKKFFFFSYTKIKILLISYLNFLNLLILYEYIIHYNNLLILKQKFNIIKIAVFNIELKYDILLELFNLESNIFIKFSFFNLSFLLLFSSLNLLIMWLIHNDYNINEFKMFLYLLIIFTLINFLLIVDNILIFYFIYEILLILIFKIIFFSSNARGGFEGSLFYAAWALIGSFLVSLGFILILTLTKTYNFYELKYFNFSNTEIYYIYYLFFFGFGTKLSIWPFWYWLPRAHVEVSTGVSIFLSCILIKVALFCLLKIQISLNSEISYNCCVIVCSLCVVDIVMRFVHLKDLKAIIAYSSVLHTNLLIILIHIDNFKILNYVLLYIWGHSYATTCLFLCVFLIEILYGTRNILFISGLWTVSGFTWYLVFFSFLFFIEFPCTLFFWAEFWLWLELLSKFYLLGLILLFLANVVFVIILFKIFWGILFGSTNIQVNIQNLNFFKKLQNITLFYIILQIILGFQPNLISFTILYI